MEADLPSPVIRCGSHAVNGAARSYAADLVVLQLGAGTQSSTMAMMAAGGLISPMPDMAVFSDTGSEPQAVYDMLEWLSEALPFEVVVASAERRLYDALWDGVDPHGNKLGSSIPMYTKHQNGSEAISRRFCTAQYKIRPGDKTIRERLGVGYRQRVPLGTTVERWWGYSVDEVERMSDSRYRWDAPRYPLIELGMRRQQVIDWWQTHVAGPGVPPLPRSACTFCPYHAPKEWAHLLAVEPQAIEEAAALEERINSYEPEDVRRYLHPRRIPLMDALRADENWRRSNPTLFESDEGGWGNACDGGCAL